VTPRNALDRIVVVGNGMVGHHFVEAASERGVLEDHEIVVIGEEPRRAYDRVHLSSVFDGMEPAALTLGAADLYEHPNLTLRTNDRVRRLDPHGHVVETERGDRIEFGSCVLATGSTPFVPPIPGTSVQHGSVGDRGPGCCDECEHTAPVVRME